MNVTYAILNLLAEHGLLADEQYIEGIRQTIRAIPNSIVIENDVFVLWAFPVNSYEIREGASEFSLNALVQPDAWFVWMAIGDLDSVLSAIPFMLLKVFFYRMNKTGDRTLREYNLAKLFRRHMKQEYSSTLPVSLNIGGNGGDPFTQLLKKRFANEAKLDKLGILKPVQQQVLQASPDNVLGRNQPQPQPDANAQPVDNGDTPGNANRRKYFQMKNVRIGAGTKNTLG